jgi:arabinofuranosyltransferase
MGGATWPNNAPQLYRLLFFIMAGLTLYCVVRLAWVGEDSYIAWRAMDNLVHGRGFRWNLYDRVQVYTNPLWVLIVSVFYALTREVYFTVLALQLACTGAVLWVLYKYVARQYLGAAVGCALLLGSRSFIDYSTSGLENPLNHLIVAIMVGLFLYSPLDERLFKRLCLLAALGLVSRLDMAMLVLPPVAYVFVSLLRNGQAKLLRLLGLGLLWSLPIWFWEAFALLYYGFPFPNTFYAKVTDVLPMSRILAQGFLYFVDSISRDGLTLLTIATGVGLGLLRGTSRSRLLAGSILLYLGYVFYIGADFMSGRFFSVPLVMAVGLVVVQPFSWPTGLASLLAAGLVGLTIQHPNLIGNPNRKYEFGDLPQTGIADERAFYNPYASLSAGINKYRMGPQEQVFGSGEIKANQAAGLPTVYGAAGYMPFFCGPGCKIVDNFALCDPFLARLPLEPSTEHRVGHYSHIIPHGYLETIGSGKNLITDSAYYRFYEVIRQLSQAPVLSAERLSTLYKFYSGEYKDLFKFCASRRYFPEQLRKATGRDTLAFGQWCRHARPTDSTQLMTFGPYDGVEAGRYKATFIVKTTAPTQTIFAQADVFLASADILAAKGEFKAQPQGPGWQYHSLEFKVHHRASAEFRLRYMGQGEVFLREIRLQKLD